MSERERVPGTAVQTTSRVSRCLTFNQCRLPPSYDSASPFTTKPLMPEGTRSSNQRSALSKAWVTGDSAKNALQPAASSASVAGGLLDAFDDEYPVVSCRLSVWERCLVRGTVVSGEGVLDRWELVHQNSVRGLALEGRDCSVAGYRGDRVAGPGGERPRRRALGSGP